MSYLHFLAFPLPGNEDQLNERLLSSAASHHHSRLNLKGSGGAGGASGGGSGTAAPSGSASSGASGSRSATRSRGRILRSTAARGRGSGVIMGSRPVVPAPYVPEELVSQNLDVNLAVNNLLSRDDEDGEDVDDDDLISLLDAGIHGDHPSVIIDADAMFSEDMFGYANLRNRTGSRGRSAVRPFGTKFVHIVALYSELVALSSTGQLHQWKWSEPEPYKNSELLQNGLRGTFLSGIEPGDCFRNSSFDCEERGVFGFWHKRPDY
ncbi:hypothetical protein HPB52_008994 [Rhipicephalus sanguineus]|uniref:E3 ubiquitin-protein ligase UBR5 ubiquitin-associated domain-containing protein n=1 Tax=Rhipicephalus sanguineus TaxID=34632 RepID=A0A9D4PLJ4_RHISA|nr:hypothetical protein HPB52_008994 [Rhipicephalus sanguineus]